MSALHAVFKDKQFLDATTSCARGHFDALVAGRWSVVQVVDLDDQRVLFAVQTPHDEAASRALTRGQVKGLTLRAQGRSYKVIAAELELPESTAWRLVRLAMQTLGIERDTELPFLFEGPAPHVPGLPSPPGLAAVSFERAGRPRLRLSYALPTCPLPLGLTAVERALVRAVLRGDTSHDIAAARRRSPRTIANQLALIFRKVGVTSRLELVARLLKASADGATSH
jgi:DNA-binding NarL/FixJ family response regulator